MRSLNKGWIGVTLVILFGISLFFFRGSSRYSNLFNSDNFVANVSGTQISTTQFLRSLEMNIGQFAQMIGEELSGDQIRAFQIHQLVLQNLVNNAIFENEFDSIDYILDDVIIAEKTKKRFPNLYVNNKINDDALNSFLRQQRLKIEDLVNIINYETRADVFDDLLFKKNYPSGFNEKINMHNNQIRNISLLKVPYEKIILPDKTSTSSVTKNDPELINYYEKNSSNYKSEEKRDISYLVLDKKNYKSSFVPNQNEILNYFEDNKKIYSIPEKRSFNQFNFKSKEEADKFKLNIQNLSDSEIIQYASNNNIIFNDFEDVDSNQVLDELSDVIFSLNNNQVSDVVSTTLAHHVIILNTISPPREPLIEEVSEKIKNTLTNVNLDNYFNDLKLKINQQILDGFSIEELASENKLKIERIDAINQASNNDDVLITSIIGSAFSQNKDFVSDIYDLNNDKSYILNVDEIYPSKVENIDTVFEVLVSDFIKSKKLSFAKEKYEITKSSQNLEKINDIFNLNIEQIDIKLKSTELPNKLIKNIFEAKLNEATFSSDNDNVYFAVIDSIQIPSEVEFSEPINLLSELKNAFGNEIIKTKNISFNDELINGLLSQYK